MEVLRWDVHDIQCSVFRTTSHDVRVTLDLYQPDNFVEQFDKITEAVDMRYIYRDSGGM